MIFIAASWKQRERVRILADRLRKMDFGVYDFTDPHCRKVKEVPPESIAEDFNPEKEKYWDYVNKKEWFAAVEENRINLDACSMLVLLLPCGMDAMADWAYVVGQRKPTFLVGNPQKGGKCLVHNWATGWFADDEQLINFLRIKDRILLF